MIREPRGGDETRPRAERVAKRSNLTSDSGRRRVPRPCVLAFRMGRWLLVPNLCPTRTSCPRTPSPLILFVTGCAVILTQITREPGAQKQQSTRVEAFVQTTTGASIVPHRLPCHFRRAAFAASSASVPEARSVGAHMLLHGGHAVMSMRAWELLQQPEAAGRSKCTLVWIGLARQLARSRRGPLASRHARNVCCRLLGASARSSRSSPASHIRRAMPVAAPTDGPGSSPPRLAVAPSECPSWELAPGPKEMTSESMASLILLKASVALIPGTCRGGGHSVRLCERRGKGVGMEQEQEQGQIRWGSANRGGSNCPEGTRRGARSTCYFAPTGRCTALTVRNLDEWDHPRDREMSFLLTPSTLAMCSRASALPSPSRDGDTTEMPTSPLFT